MYYYLSKFLGPLLNPTNFLFIILGILFICYLISKRKIILKILSLNIFLIIIVAFFPAGSLGLKYLEKDFIIKKEYKNIKNLSLACNFESNYSKNFPKKSIKI